MPVFTGNITDYNIFQGLAAQIAIYVANTNTPATLQNVTGNIIVADAGGVVTWPQGSTASGDYGSFETDACN